MSEPRKATQSDPLLTQMGKSSERASDLHRVTWHNDSESGLEPRASDFLFSALPQLPPTSPPPHPPYCLVMKVLSPTYT